MSWSHYRCTCLRQVLEEVPRTEHCGIINALTSLAGRWVAVTMGQLVSAAQHFDSCVDARNSAEAGLLVLCRGRAAATTLQIGTGEGVPGTWAGKGEGHKARP